MTCEPVLYDSPTTLYDEPTVTYDGLTIGCYSFAGCVIEAELSIGGTVEADPDFSTLSPDVTTTFPDTVGNTWILVGTAEIECVFPVPPLIPLARLGCEPWSVYITERGSDKPILEIPFVLAEMSRQLDALSLGRISLPNDFAKFTHCCDVLAQVEPFAHEVAFYRGDRQVWCGPVWDVVIEPNEAVIQAKDILSWMERRFVGEDQFLAGDASDVFRTLLEIGFAADNSSNPQFIFGESGVNVERRYLNVEFSRVFDLLQELSRTAVDYTVINRLIIVSGRQDEQQRQKRLILHDDGVIAARVEKEGANFATDIAVFGATPPGAEEPVIGRAQRGISFYGLVQDSAADLYIEDSTSANANALARVLAMQPAPRRLKAQLSEDAALGFDELVPGNWIDVRLNHVLGCEKGIFQLMRLEEVRGVLQVNPGAGQREVVEVTLLPIGLTQESG